MSETLSLAIVLAVSMASAPAMAGEEPGGTEDGGEADAGDSTSPATVGGAGSEPTPVPQQAVPPAPQPPAVPPSPAPPPALPPEARLSLGGFTSFDWYQYLQEPGDLAPDDKEPVPAVATVRIAPRLSGGWGPVRGLAEVEFRHDFLDTGRGSRVIVREARAGFRKAGFHLDGGALQVRWGKMDVASPTDNLVAWDYEEFLFPEPLPIPGIAAGFARGVFSTEVVVSPAFVPSRYRHESPSRWDNTWFLPRQQVVPAGAMGDLVFANRYETFTGPVLPGSGPSLLRAWDVGARVDLFLPQVDLGLSFAATRDRLPSYTGFQVTNNKDGDGDGLPDHIVSREALLEVVPYHERLLVPGFDVAVSAWRLVIRAEGAYFHTADPGGENCLVDDPYVKYAAGVELALPDLVGSFGLAIRVQYNGDVAVTGAETRQQQADACPDDQVITIADPEVGLVLTDWESGFVGVPAIRHPYAHGWYWDVDLAFTPDLGLDVRGFFDVAGDALLRARFRFVLLGRLELSAGALVMLATGEDTVFTPFGRNSRAEVGLAWRF